MKILILLFCVFTLASCSDVKPVDNCCPEPVRMICVDGELYYDTGVHSENVPRCGTFDRELKEQFDEYSVPDINYGYNFNVDNDYIGYQSNGDLVKEVPIDGNWVMFKKITETEKDLLDYKYCYRLSGILPNAAIKSRYIVLANKKNLTFEQVSKSLFSSNTNDFLDVYIIPELPEDGWGLTMYTKDVTAEGLNIVFEQFAGSPTGELQTGESFTLDINVDGKWESVNTKLINVVWNSIAYGINKNSITEQSVNWKWLYGNLNPGHYRIGKEIMDYRAPGDYDKKMYYTEFIIY